MSLKILIDFYITNTSAKHHNTIQIYITGYTILLILLSFITKFS